MNRRYRAGEINQSEQQPSQGRALMEGRKHQSRRGLPEEFEQLEVRMQIPTRQPLHTAHQTKGNNLL